MSMKGFNQISLLSGAIIFAVLLSIISCRGDKSEETNQNSQGLPIPGVEYVGRESCKSCHEKEYNLFQGSDHDQAMDHATDSTVLGDFDDASFTNFGITSRFFRRDGKYYVNTEGPDGNMTDYEIQYVFGVRPLQQYLIEFPGGRYQCLPICWDTRPTSTMSHLRRRARCSSGTSSKGP